MIKERIPHELSVASALVDVQPLQLQHILVEILLEVLHLSGAGQAEAKEDEPW